MRRQNEIVSGELRERLKVEEERKKERKRKDKLSQTDRERERERNCRGERCVRVAEGLASVEGLCLGLRAGHSSSGHRHRLHSHRPQGRANSLGGFIGTF